MKFEEIQTKINRFIAEISSKKDIFFRGEKLQLSDALFCAQDKARNKQFFYAIQKAMNDFFKKNNKTISVIDAGAGIGVLGVFALIHGAQKVTFIEENPVTTRALRAFIDYFGYNDHSEIICGDATRVYGIQEVDMIISETIAIDFTSEDFHSIITNLKTYLKPEGRILPEKFEISMQGEQYNSERAISVYDDISKPGFLDIPSNTTLSGTCYVYEDIVLQSGDCVSFFNERTV